MAQLVDNRTVELFEETPIDRAFAEFNQEKKDFLDRNMARFYKVYRETQSDSAYVVYRQLLEARQRQS